MLVISMERVAKRNAIDRTMADALDDALNELDDDSEPVGRCPDRRRRRLQCGQRSDRRGRLQHGARRGVRDHSASAPKAVDRCRRGPGARRWPRDRPRLRPGGGSQFGAVPATRGHHRSDPDLRRPVPDAADAPPQRRPATDPHRASDSGGTRLDEVGFVNVLTPPGQALHEALELARQLCANAPVSVQSCLSAVNEIIAVDDALGWEQTDQALRSATASADAREGVASFLEKRRPVWTGR